MSKNNPSNAFPLWFHRGSGQWAKKIRPRNQTRSRTYYFGTDRDHALGRYVNEREAILEGRSVQVAADALSVVELVNQFLTIRRGHVDSGELSAGAWGQYYHVGEQIIETFGKDRAVHNLTPSDFGRLRASVAKRFKPNTLAKFITIVKTIFNFAYKAELIPTPVRFGNLFDKPSRRSIRMRRAERGPMLVEPAAIWRLLAEADATMRAVVLLGVNCAYGQRDCADLQRKALKVKPGWLCEARRKTGIDRVAKLWPETIDALAEAAKVRPDPLDPADADCVFLTAAGHRLVRFHDRGADERGNHIDAAASMFRKLVRKAGVTWPGGPYTLRHVFATVASDTTDEVAIGLVMGHCDGSMGARYRQRIGDDRVDAVCSHVRAWLLAGKPAAEAGGDVLPFKLVAV